MDIQTARQTAKNWTYLFCLPFYVIELADGIYDVTARVTPHHKIVSGGYESRGHGTSPGQSLQ